VVPKVIESSNVTDAILGELRKDYDLLVLGASEKDRGSDTLFTPIVDYMVRFAPCPSIVVHGQRIKENWDPHAVFWCPPTAATRPNMPPNWPLPSPLKQMMRCLY
jgi:hypothetical protein